MPDLIILRSGIGFGGNVTVTYRELEIKTNMIMLLWVHFLCLSKMDNNCMSNFFFFFCNSSSKTIRLISKAACAKQIWKPDDSDVGSSLIPVAVNELLSR